MNLTQQEKEILQSLLDHPWFAIVQKLEEEAQNKLGKQFLNLDWNDPKKIEILKMNQIYTKARQDFFQNLKKWAIQVYENEFKWF